jgi:hypothetical protein
VDINSNDLDVTCDVERPCPGGPRASCFRRGYIVGGPVLLVAATLGLGLAGCGDSGNKAGASASASTSSDSNAEKLVKFAQCMRQNGVPNFPDPVNDQLALQVTQGGPLDPTNPTFQSAREKCKSLEPPGVLGGGGQNTQQQEQLLQFVNCMRTNGVPNFPDPQAQGGGIIMGDGQIDPNSPAFQKAMQTCRNLLPGGGGQ